MTGRDLFDKFRFVIKVFSYCTSIIPLPVFNLLYDISSNSESKAALLLRYFYIKKYAKNCGNNIYIGSNVKLKNISELSLGDNVSIHAFCYIDAIGEIIIGNNVSIANMTSIISFDHTWDKKDLPIKYNKVILKKIEISNDVWIGSNAKILGDTVINQRVIVAAGAVVNKDVASYSIVGGIPAKLIKHTH